MLVDPVMKRAELIFRRLQRQRRAKLRLTAGTLEKDHQIARHRQRRGSTEILLHQRQRQTDPGAHARRSPDRALRKLSRPARPSPPPGANKAAFLLRPRPYHWRMRTPEAAP